MRAPFWFLIFLAGAGAAGAQTRIPPETFLDEAVGRTLTFSMIGTGEIVGTEFFLSREQSVWEQADGTCTRGRITTPDGKICFLYDHQPERGPVCWWTFRYEGRLMVRIASFSDNEVQIVSEVSDTPFFCGGEPIS